MSIVNPQVIIDNGWISTFKKSCVQGNSIDLRVRSVFRIDGGITVHKDGQRELPEYKLVEPEVISDQPSVLGDKYFVLEPEHLYQIEFEEFVSLPGHIASLTVLRSSMFKSGASGETGLFDSGYEGYTGMTVNVKFKSFVAVGAPIAQMIFFEAEAAKMYDGMYGGSLTEKLNVKM